jgi:DNA-binding HxlR family transcriptional regulator
MPETIASEPFTFEQPCPIRDILDRIGDQWSLLILETLQGRTIRFNALSPQNGNFRTVWIQRQQCCFPRIRACTPVL